MLVHDMRLIVNKYSAKVGVFAEIYNSVLLFVNK